MRACATCRTNRTTRDGGTIGLCWEHIKKRCRNCGEISNGKSECMKCAHEVDLARWTALSEMRRYDEERMAEIEEVRKEKMHKARVLAHEAVEILFQSLISVVQAVHGKPPEISQPTFRMFVSDVKTGE